ncbi:hypothetical protein R6Q59_007820 [Mikania micrantha]
MGYNCSSAQGKIPKTGAIFMSNIKTMEECLERKLFGLPSGLSDFVLHVKEGMMLFLFEFERRLLYGVYRATCDGEINIEPKAFRSSGKHFPAQVRFTTVWDCSPLAENEFKDVIRDNYFSGKKFNFGLNEKQVSKLMKLFRSNILSNNHHKRNIWRHDDKPSEGKARSHDLRKDLRHRLRSDSCDFRGDEVKVDDNMYINKHIMESRRKDSRKDFLADYMTEKDEFDDCGRHDILGKHFDPREKHIEDDYMDVFSRPHRMHLEEIGVGSSGFLGDGENNDLIAYNRLQDEYKVREGFWGSLDEQSLTNRIFSPFNQKVYSNSDPTRIDVPDIELSPPCFDDGSSFIPIANDRPFYPSPKDIPIANDRPFYPSPKDIHASKSLPYYSHDEESIRYDDDPGSQSSIFPKFISRNLSFDDDLRAHEVDPIDYDKRFYEAHENQHLFGTTNKRASVFSRISSTLRHEEQAFENDEKHELNSSVDKVMKMLEKVASNPTKRKGKRSLVVKQDDDDNSVDSKMEDHGFLDVNLEVDADVALEEVEGESTFQETRLVNFKRRKKSNKRIDDAYKESSECLVGATSDVGPIETDQLMGMYRKRRKLVRPSFVEKNLIPDGESAQEQNTVSENNSVSMKVVETSEKVDTFINSTNDIVTVPSSFENTLDGSNITKTGIESSEKVDAFINSMDDTITVLENTPGDSNSTKVGTESSEKVDASTKLIDLNMLPTEDESSSSKDDTNSAKASHGSSAECEKKGKEGVGNTENRLASSVFVEVVPPKDDQKMCGWIEW